jgi:hypothetical protein
LLIWQVPELLQPNPVIDGLFAGAHEFGAKALLALISLHAGAALFHWRWFCVTACWNGCCGGTRGEPELMTLTLSQLRITWNKTAPRAVLPGCAVPP